ncbi:hypothetical protein JCM33374_g5952 [Metschnikowia sp. JCM 33374]|nr:hypothetical protein JCM33374_g5952 [Metschnikowia sp. JCM 33374]
MPETKDFTIHEAAREDKVLTVQNLVRESPQLAIMKDEDSRTPLHWACTMNNERIIEILLPYVKVDLDELVDDSGWTPVHIVAALGNLKVLKKFMERDPRPDIDLATNTGATGLHLAVSKNHYDLVSELIHTYKCSVRAKDRKGYTALHRAAAIGSQPLIRMLVEAKANINATDQDGWTPLHHALAEGHGDVGVLLVSLGADPSAETGAGETPADVATDDNVRKFFEKGI